VQCEHACAVSVNSIAEMLLPPRTWFQCFMKLLGRLELSLNSICFAELIWISWLFQAALMVIV